MPLPTARRLTALIGCLAACCSIQSNGKDESGIEKVLFGVLREAGDGVTSRDLPLVGSRVALSGAYLALEATLTGNLWLAIATNTAGLLTAILLCKRPAGEPAQQ